MNSPRATPANALTPAAFAILLGTACLFAGNHVAARIAMDHGTSVVTAVASRSMVTALVVAMVLAVYRVPLAMTPRHRRVMPVVAVLVALQSVWLYSAVARIPPGLALLAFNLYPVTGALWSWALYRERPARSLVVAMPLILAGLALALDVAGAASGLGAQGQWARIGSGVAYAVAAAVSFGLVLALTQHAVGDLDGRVRTALTQGVVGVLALIAALAGDGLHFPGTPTGWAGLAALTLLYGTAFSVMFTVLPRLGAVSSSPIMNVEPVAALLMGWALLGQTLSPIQWAGALLVVGTVMALGLRRR